MGGLSAVVSLAFIAAAWLAIATVIPLTQELAEVLLRVT
jgi:hypothetical protein